MSTQVGPLQQEYRSRGGVSYSIELTHPNLHRHRVIKGSESGVVFAKARLQAAEWDDQWNRRMSAAAKSADRDSRTRKAQADKDARRRYLEDMKGEAARRTAEAKALQERLGSVLSETLAHDDAIDFDSLKDRRPFPTPKPKKPTYPRRPAEQPVPVAPRREDPKYEPSLGFLDKLIPSRRAAKESAAAQAFDADLTQWRLGKERVEDSNRAAAEFHTLQIAELDAAHAESVRTWERARDEFAAEQAQGQAVVDAFRARYEARDPEAITEYFDMVLAGSMYPDCLPQEFEIDFNAESGILAVDYRLPAPADLPTLTEVKYVQSDDSFTEKHLPEGQRAKVYDELVYQIVLRTVHELFEADRLDVLRAVVFNGIVTSIDRATGKQATACILSLQAQRAAFLEINLANVDPKACFRQLKGVGSSKLHSVTPVAPILPLRREDGRFVAAHDVAAGLSEGYNLATMPWEEFEHLIREIFGREFSSAGGEVKVTRASRDGGVDAVAFDPDPIRGGKIVIQAKRYTNTVGVSAVRDLYGTVMNEGATKGILVTTSDYGPDAYEFANGKPLTLLSGANLLHLLGKHGVQARIDLAEARREALAKSPGA